MRKRTRALALLLTLLTLVGLVPFAVFADTGSTVAADESEASNDSAFMENLAATEGVTLLGGTDFEAGTFKGATNTFTGLLTHKDETTGKLVATKVENMTLGEATTKNVAPGLYLPDYRYNWVDQIYHNNADGTQWNIYHPQTSGRAMYHAKRSLGELVEENGNVFLRSHLQSLQAKDAYIDAIASGHTAGSSYVATVKVRKDEKTKTMGDLNLIQLCYRNYMQGTAISTGGTMPGGQTMWVTLLTHDSAGRVWAYDSITQTKTQVGVILATEFTTFTAKMIFGETAADSKAEIYVNGYLMATVNFLTEANLKGIGSYTFATPIKPTDIKIANGNTAARMGLQSNNSESQYGYFDVDDFAVYMTEGDPIEAKYEGEGENRAPIAAPNGWVQTEEGYWRYYENGVPALFEKTVGGVTYYFEQTGAYLAEKVMDKFTDFDTPLKGKNGDQVADTVSKANAMGPTNEIRGSGKYTYLWADWFKDSNSTLWQQPALKFGGNYYLSSSYTTTAAEEDNWTAKRWWTDSSSMIDWEDYDAFEIVAFTDVLTKERVFITSDFKGWSTTASTEVDGEYTSVYDGFASGLYTSGRNGFNLAVDFVPANNGWNTWTIFFNPNHKTAGSYNVTQDRGLPPFYTGNLSFSLTWSNTNTKQENLDKGKFYLDNIYLVKYVPLKTDEIPAGGFTTDANGNTRYLDGSGKALTGWQTIGDSEYYFYPATGYMAKGNAVVPVTVEDGTVTVYKTYSGATADGTATDVAKYRVDFVGMSFTSTGECTDKTATGWFTVKNSLYKDIDVIYIDGVLQTGAFEYDNNGNDVIDDNEKYYASGDGTIFSNIGEIGYIYDNEFDTSVAEGQGSVTDRPYILAFDFDDLTAGTFYGNRSGSRNAENVGFQGCSTLQLRSKLSHFEIFAESEGDNALKVQNQGALVDSYINIGFTFSWESAAVGGKTYPLYNVYTNGAKSTVPSYNVNGDAREMKSVVIEFDAMLEADWNADATLMTVIGYKLDNKSREPGRVGSILRVNEQGYVYPRNNPSMLLCKMSDTVYTNFALVCDQTVNTCDIYVNGVLMVDNYKYASGVDGNWAITEGRMFQYGADTKGTGYIDNMYIFLGDAPSHKVEESEITRKDKWVYEGGVWRFYTNSVMTTSNSELPVRIDDQGNIDPNGATASYYFDSKNGMCIGTAEGWVNGSYFIEGKIQGNMWTDDITGLGDDAVAGKRYVKEDGTMAKGYFEIDGMLYYFNSNSGVLELGGYYNTESLVTVKQLVEKAQGDAYNLGGNSSFYAMTMHTDSNGAWKQMTYGNSMDITDYYKQSNKGVKVDIYVGDTYDASFSLIFTNVRRFYELEFNTETGAFELVTDGKQYGESEFNAIKHTEYTSTKDALKNAIASAYGVDASTLSNSVHAIDTKIPGSGSDNYQTMFVNVVGNETDGYEFYGRRYSYHMTSAYHTAGAYNLKDLQVGWNTLYVPMTKFGDSGAFIPSEVNNFGINIGGWGLKCNATNMVVRLGDFEFYTLGENDGTVYDGRQGTKFYQNSHIPVTNSFYTYLESEYYADETGNYVTGLQVIDGILYEFGNDGKLIGVVNGKCTVPGITGKGDTTAEVQMEKVFVNGVLQTGFYDGDVDYVLSETTGEITKDTKVYVEISGTPYIYACGADGAASKAGQGVHEVGDARYYTLSTGIVQVGKAVYYAKEKLFLDCGEDGKLTVNGFGEYTNAYHGEDGNAYALSIYGVNVAVSSDVTYNVYVNYPAGLAAAQLRVVMTNVFADLKVTFNFCDRTETVSIADAEQVTINGLTYLKVSFEGISAKKLGDDVTVTVTNGEKVMPAECTNSGSVADYLYALLGTTAEVADAEMKALAVQLLNYGAAAQTYFGYNTEALVNAELTEEQKAYAAGLTLPELNETDHKEVAVSNNGLTVDDGRIDPAMFALSLDNKVNLIVGFNKEAVESFYGENPELYVYFGTATEGVRLEAGEDDLAGYYVAKAPVDIKTLTARVSITVKDSEGTVVSGTFEYGVCSYALFVANDGETDDLDALMEALLLYGEAADTYAEAALTGGLNTENNPVNDPFEDDMKWNS